VLDTAVSVHTGFVPRTNPIDAAEVAEGDDARVDVGTLGLQETAHDDGVGVGECLVVRVSQRNESLTDIELAMIQNQAQPSKKTLPN
jgi:hypothetical protein